MAFRLYLPGVRASTQFGTTFAEPPLEANR